MENVKHEGSKVYIYTRVSTAMQVDGYSLDAQKDEIMRYVDYKNMHVCGEYTDEGKSGKSIQGRPGFQKMISDISDNKDGISFVICYKLSRFGRNTADILNSLKLMKRYGTHLICVKENIDSSLDSGKMMISILGAMAEIERDNISIQTMAGRKEKAKQGGWNGAKPPYGYYLSDGKLIVKEEEAEHIRLIYDKFVHTSLGTRGVARWMNEHGYRKFTTTHNSLECFTYKFIEKVIENQTYCGKIAYGKRKTVLRDGTENDYHKIITDDYLVVEGHQEAIVSEELWKAALTKKHSNGGKKETIDKDHQYVYSALLKCPICGKSLYGIPMRNHYQRKDGKTSALSYAYACRSDVHINGIHCGYGQISCRLIDNSMKEIISSVVNPNTFGDIMADLVGKRIDTKEIELELETAKKTQKQALGLQRKLENELDMLDVTDKHYDRKYESLSRRLDEAFDTIDSADEKVKDCEGRLESIKKQGISRESVYESLKLFDKLFDKMTDHEKKSFVNSFIDRIELYPDKKGKNGNPIKAVHFKFPVSYEGKSVYTITPPLWNTVETCVLLVRESEKEEKTVSIKVNLDGLNIKQHKPLSEPKPTYDNIKKWVKDNYGFEVSSLYIAQTKDKTGIKERENYNIGSKDSRIPICPKEKEEAILEAFKHFNMI